MTSCKKPASRCQSQLQFAMKSVISASTLQPVNLAQALDAFVLRSPHEAQPHVAAIFEHVQGCLAYDPNYADDMDAEDMDEDAEDDDECDSLSFAGAISFADLLVQSQGVTAALDIPVGVRTNGD